MKILVVRFSSIGDVVLTTPVLRCIKQQLKDVELHYLTRQNFLNVIENNPYVDRFFAIKKSLYEVVPQLKTENYDYVIDLHHNLRTLSLKRALGKKAFSFNKLNLEKWLMVHLKLNRLPHQHIVDRYFETLSSLGVKNDNQGLDHFIHEKDQINIQSYLPTPFQNGYNVLVVGGSYFTKQIPPNKLKEFCEQSSLPLVLLGGKDDMETAEKIHQVFKEKTINLCGSLNINQSSSVIRQSNKVITSDTGLMHIAAAYKKDIISVWGNTIPEFGMGPYLPGSSSHILEVKNLPCRPCSKLGYSKCPKGHFKCMNNIDVSRVSF
ncbi:MAG: glycosyl transferase family 9 [Bacteroidetes bacterium]|nr:glycosyl transferase family 9 [Bacteroidota bacterium]MDF2450962.1 glycosyl transferase family 9 [Bacteroidota bacterium]